MRLFGSVARNEHQEGSDIDLFVTMPPKFYNHILVAQYLEELLGCSIDFIQDNRNIRPFFRQQIEHDGGNISFFFFAEFQAHMGSVSLPLTLISRALQNVVTNPSPWKGEDRRG